MRSIAEKVSLVQNSPVHDEKRFRLLTSSEVAAYCAVSTRTVNRWISKRELKARKIPGGSDYRIELGDFLNFLIQNNWWIPEEFSSLLDGFEKPLAKKALIVDDEPFVTRSLERMFERMGWVTQTANDGFTAGFMAQSFEPTLVTLDLGMPDLNGQEVLKKLKANPLLKNTKVVVVSGATLEEIGNTLIRGADGALCKPFSFVDLSELVNRIFPNLKPGA